MPANGLDDARPATADSGVRSPRSVHGRQLLRHINSLPSATFRGRSNSTR